MASIYAVREKSGEGRAREALRFEPDVEQFRFHFPLFARCHSASFDGGGISDLGAMPRGMSRSQ